MFSPHKYIRQVAHEAVYDVVRYVLWYWGLCYFFRVDNGSPFGVPSRDSFSVLHLCLVAHGVHLHLNPPRSPTRNAKVERNQGTTAKWAEPRKCKNYLEVQHRLNEVVIDQRERYPTRVCNGKTRLEAYPGLTSNAARFNTADFDLNRVYRFLQKGEWKRDVSERGKVMLFGQYYQLTAKNKGKRVTAKFNAATVNWDFYDHRGDLLISLKPKGLSEQELKTGKLL